MMGGLGRSIDGSYAQYTVVDAAHVIPFDSDLPWELLGALPETLQTAHGAVTTGLQLQADQTVLIHGGTSTVGLTAIALAHRLGATVIATTRNPTNVDLLKRVGADYALIDADGLPEKVAEIAQTGVDGVLEFVSAHSLPAMLFLVRTGGTVCFVGSLADEWTIPQFSPFAIPNGVRLTSYAGRALDLPADALARYLAAIEAGTLEIVIAGVYSGLDGVVTAHRAFEGARRPGKNVVVLTAT